MELISVVIPVYNLEEYIKECIDSVIEQTYPCLEIILIDYGSSDRTPQICNDYANKDSRVVVLYLSNADLSGARNAGIDYAKGEWVVFVDADDYLHPDMIKVLHDTAKMNDVLYVRCNEIYSSQGRSEYVWANACGETYPLKRISASDEMKNILEKKALFSVWGSIYHRTILEGVRFPLGFYYEDQVFTTEVLGRVEKLIRVEGALYFYRYRVSSITQAKRLQTTRDYCEMIMQRNRSVCLHFPILKSLACERYCSELINQFNRINCKEGIPYKRWMKQNLRRLMNEVPLSLVLDKELPFYRRCIVLACKLSFPITCWIKRNSQTIRLNSR